MGKVKVSSHQMIAAANYLSTVSGRINSSLASVQSKIDVIKKAAQKLDSYNGQIVEGRENIKELKSSSTYNAGEHLYRTTKYRVFDEVWNISGQSVIEANASRIEKELTNCINKVTTNLENYSSRVKGNAQAVSAKQKKIEMILNNKEFSKYFKNNIFYNKNKSDRAGVDESSIPYWTKEKLSFKPVGNNTYVIYKGGVAMGFTTGKAVSAYLNYKNSKAQSVATNSSGKLSNAEYEKLRQARIREAEGRKKQSASGKLSDAEYEKLRQARLREAEGRKKQQKIEADKIRTQNQAATASANAGKKSSQKISTAAGKSIKDEIDKLKKKMQAANKERPAATNTQHSVGYQKNGEATSTFKAESYGDKIINEARAYKGKIPYKWGGKAENGKIPADGMDCSGFVDYVVKKATGKPGGVGTYGLRDNCTPVSKNDLQPGDLAFRFGAGDDRHVGIYVGKKNGQMMFIHENDTVHNVSEDNYNGWTEFGRLKR